MSLQAAIHNYWGAFPELTNLVPAARFSTGWQVPAEYTKPQTLPHVALEQTGTPQVMLTSSRRQIALNDLAFHVFADNLTGAHTLANAIARRFHRLSLTWGNEVLQDLRPTNRTETKHPDGVWEIILTYAARVETTY